MTVSLSGREQLRTPVRSGATWRSIRAPAERERAAPAGRRPTGPFHAGPPPLPRLRASAAPRWWPPPTSASPRPPAAARSRPARSRPSSTTSTTSLTDSARPTANLITVDRPRGRHRVASRCPALGERPGHHHLDRDDHRRGARPAARQGRRSPSPTPVPSCCSTSSPAAPTPPSRRTPRSGSPPPSPRARCSTPPRSCSATSVEQLKSKDGVVTAPDGSSRDVRRAGRRRPPARRTRQVEVELKDAGDFRVIGTPRNRVDALDAVTGRKEFTTDLDRSRARCRPWSAGRPRSTAPPSGSATGPRSWRCPASPTSSVVDTGVAVRAQHLRPVHRRGPGAETWSGTPARWPASPTTRRSLAELQGRRAPAAAGAGQPAGRRPSRRDFTFYFRSNSALDTNCGDRRRPRRPGRDLGRAEVADRRPGSGSPRRSACPQHAVTVHVMHGRRLVRPPAVLRRRPRGRQDLAGDGQAGQADVAPRRRRPGRAAATRWPPRRVRAIVRRQRRCSPSTSATPASRPTSGTGSARSSPPWPPTCPPAWATSASPRRSSR